MLLLINGVFGEGTLVWAIDPPGSLEEILPLSKTRANSLGAADFWLLISKGAAVVLGEGVPTTLASSKLTGPSLCTSAARCCGFAGRSFDGGGRTFRLTSTTSKSLCLRAGFRHHLSMSYRWLFLTHNLRIGPTHKPKAALCISRFGKNRRRHSGVNIGTDTPFNGRGGLPGGSSRSSKSCFDFTNAPLYLPPPLSIRPRISYEFD